MTTEVERLLGFRSEQFRQVVLLPQGQFRRLLLSGSKDREDILEVLFQTETYRRIELALKEAAQGIETAVQALRQRHQLILEQAEVAITALEEQLGDLRHADPAALAERLHAAQRQLKEAQTALARLEKLGRQDIELQQDAVQATAERESVEAAWREALGQQGQHEGLVRARAEHIPEALRDLATLATAITEAQEHMQALTQALEQAGAQSAQAQRDLAVQEATLQGAQVMVHSAHQRAAEVQQTVTRFEP